jgi:hypothetical protein
MRLAAIFLGIGAFEFCLLYFACGVEFWPAIISTVVTLVGMGVLGLLALLFLH